MRGKGYRRVLIEAAWCCCPPVRSRWRRDFFFFCSTWRAFARLGWGFVARGAFLLERWGWLGGNRAFGRLWDGSMRYFGVVVVVVVVVVLLPEMMMRDFEMQRRALRWGIFLGVGTRYFVGGFPGGFGVRVGLASGGCWGWDSGLARLGFGRFGWRCVPKRRGLVLEGRVGVWEVPRRVVGSGVEVSISLLGAARGCKWLRVGVWMAVRGRSWLVGSSFLRMGLGSFECGEELARRLLMVSGEADRGFDARPSWMSSSESGRLSVAKFCSIQRWIWIRAFRGSRGGLSDGDNLGGHFYGHRSKQEARKR